MPGSPHIDQLVTSAQRHMRDALNAWKNNEHSNVASYAPTAIEHLGKAALWAINPVLLAPLDAKKEKTFIALVTNPSLETAFTIGLELVLQRLEAVVPNLRVLDQDRRSKIKNARNGAVHVGNAPKTKDLLVDCLECTGLILAQLDGVDAADFYGDHFGLVGQIQQGHYSEITARVQEKLRRARKHYNSLIDGFGDDDIGEIAERLDAQYQRKLSISGYASEELHARRDCPACTNPGWLIGWADIDYDVDYDHELDGDRYIAVPYVTTNKVTLSPDAFHCAVCRLSLQGADELPRANLTIEPYVVKDDDLPEDLDLSDLIDEPDGYTYTR